MKKLATVVSGWHYPLHFYKSIAEQALPKGWEADLFVVSHREPKFARPEVKEFLETLPKDDLRAKLDRKLYKKVATQKDIEKLGWKYIKEPNTIGDWGNVNQWLEKNDYKKYDLFLFSHDDNYIINNTLIYSVINTGFDDWDMVTNSTGMPMGSIRGSFEFFKPKVLDLLGGRFDLSKVKMTREGKTDSPKDKNELYDWNNTVTPLNETIIKNKLKVSALSPQYRVSMFCIEGERGFISKTHGINTAYENQGLKVLNEAGLI